MVEVAGWPADADELGATRVARLLGVHPSTLKRWPIAYRQVGAFGRRRYRRADVEAFLDRIRVEAAG